MTTQSRLLALRESATEILVDRAMKPALRLLVPTLPRQVKRALAGPAIHRDDLVLDLDTQLLLRLQGIARQKSSDTNRDVTRMRRNTRLVTRLVSGRTVPVTTEDITVEGGAGRLRARLYHPERADSLLVYFHGGGWVHGDLDTHDAACRVLAQAARVCIAAVDYRRAPEDPYPAAVDDAVESFSDLVEQAPRLGFSHTQVAIGGDSAGAYLAAVACHRLKNDARPSPCAQLLIYPPTDFATRYPSRDIFADGFFLTEPDIAFFERSFLPAELDKSLPEVSPLRADADNLPPAVIITAGFDPLRDEGEAYAQRLLDHGTAATVRRFDHYTHGFFNNLLICQPDVVEIGGLLRAALPGSRNSG